MQQDRNVVSIDAASHTMEVAQDTPALRPEPLVPLPSRLRGAGDARVEILRRHDRAVADAMPTYVDPISGFSVFTAAFLAARGYCCTTGCRHCPYAVEE